MLSTDKLNSNTVELLGWYGSDETVACSAWTSTDRELTSEKRDRIPQLIKKLWEDGHETPFEKIQFHFLVNTDIATHIHLLKHRISSLNAECLEGSTLISFENNTGAIGQKISIKELYKKFNSGRKHQNTEKDKQYSRRRIRKMRIRVLNERTGIFTSSNIKDIWKTGPKDIYKIKLRNGKEILCSDNHPIYTNNGYKTIARGLKNGDMVGCNGITICKPNKPWTFPEFFVDAKNFTRLEFAKHKNIKYNLCKKWGYIFNITFKEDCNKNFKKGHTPWNKGVFGYDIDISNRKHNPLKGKDCHFWRGGITSEREKIGAWTTKNAAIVHKKYGYTCQRCGISNGKLHAHHIISVAQNINEAYNIDNLITVCNACHVEIHRTIENEKEFTESILKRDVILSYEKRLNRKINNLKYLIFSDIVSIEYIKHEECYDIEIEGEYKNFVANGIVTHNSARYKELKEDKYYLPEDWKGIIVKEQLEDSDGPVNKMIDWYETLDQFTYQSNLLYHKCLKELSPILGRKRAKESARYFKTYNSQITADVMFNGRSFMNFQKLRNSEHAQKEIRELSQKMLELIKNIPDNPFQYTLQAWGK